MTTLRQLAYFVAVADEGSFTRAARRIGVAQPSLSQQIRVLEVRLGGALFERLPRSLHLTPAGKALLPQARITVQAAEQAVRAGRAALDIEGGELELCTTRSVAVGLVPELMRQWHARHPRVRIRLREFGAGQLEERIHEGVGDLGIGPPPPNWSGPITELGWEEFALVLSNTDPLAKLAAVPLSALATREWVMFDRTLGLTDLIASACVALANYEPVTGFETSQVETAARLAAVGMGPTLVPRSIIPADIQAAVALPVAPPVGRLLAVYTRSAWSPLSRAFVEMLHEQHWEPRPPGAYALG